MRDFGGRKAEHEYQGDDATKQTKESTSTSRGGDLAFFVMHIVAQERGGDKRIEVVVLL